MEVYEVKNPFWSKKYLQIQGRVASITPMVTGNGRTMGCSQIVTLWDDEENITNFLVSPNTYVVDLFRIKEGAEVEFFFDELAAIPLIYPPRYNAVIAVEKVPGVNWTAGYFDAALMNAEYSLKLNLGPKTEIVTRNNQPFSGRPGNHNLLVEYSMTTRSIPAQTVPERVIVMCNMEG